MPQFAIIRARTKPILRVRPQERATVRRSPQLRLSLSGIIGMQARIGRNIVRLAGGTAVSRVFGFLRELVCAAVFGAGSAMDLLVIALTPVTLFRRILGEDVVERAFMPPFKVAITQKRHRDAFQILASCLNLIVFGSLLTMVLLFLAAPLLVGLIAPGLTGPEAEDAVRMLQLLAPFVVPIGIAASLGGTLNALECNRVYALAPVFLSVGVIASVWFGHQSLGMFALPLGFVLGAVLQAAVQVPFVLRELRAMPDAHYSIRAWSSKGVGKQVRWVCGKAFMDKGVEICDRILASWLIAGSMSSLWFAQRLVQLPLAIFGLAISRGITPFLAEKHAQADRQQFTAAIRRGMRLNLLALAPVAVWLVVAREPIVALVFQRGAFTQANVSTTGLALAAYAVGLPALGMQALLSRVFSVYSQNRTVLLISLAGAIVNIVLNLALVQSPLGHAGLALASSLSFWLIVVLQLRKLRRLHELLVLPGLLPLASCLAASLAACWLATQSVALVKLPYGWLAHILRCAVAAGVTGAVFLPVFPLMRNRR